jgi:AraC-like DNA-binding protein
MVVMVVLTGVVYIATQNTIRTEINNSNILLLENIRNQIDRSLTEINDFSLAIFSSPEIRDVSIMSENDYSFYYKLYKAAQSLYDYKILKYPQFSYYIYLGGCDRVMWPGTVNYANYYYDQYIQSTDFSLEKWRDSISQLYYGEYIFLPYKDSTPGISFELALIRSMPYSTMGTVTNIVIMMNFSKILDEGGQDRFIAVLDANNDVLSQSTSAAVLETAGLNKMPGDHGSFTRQVNGRKEVVSYIASREYNWKYITVTPEYIFWEKASFIRLIMWGEIVLGLLGMGILSFYFIRRNYNILREITSFIRSTQHSEIICRGNEFNYIRQVLTQSIEKQQEAESYMDRQIGILRTNLLIGLLEGYEMSVPLDELLTTYNIQFPHPYFTVTAVYIEKMNSTLWGSRDKATCISAVTAVMNVMKEILNRNNVAYVVEFRNYILCVINTSFVWQEFRKSLNEDLKNARDFIAQNLDIELCVASGSLYHSPEDIHHAYNEAQSSMDYARILGRGQTTFFDDIDNRGAGCGIYPFEKERFLLNYLRISDLDGVRKTIDDIFCEDFLKPSVSHETVRFIVLALSFHVLRNMFNEDDMNKQLDEKNGYIKHLLNCNTIIEMKEPMLLLLKDIMNIVREEKKQLSTAIQEYIIRHYADPQMNIESIADTIGKSPYYISKKFKIETGSGILDFINKIRIEKAKELLKTTELNQEQIAESTGFTSVRTYQRTFRKIEGVTSGQFKQSINQTKFLMG